MKDVQSNSRFSPSRFDLKHLLNQPSPLRFQRGFSNTPSIIEKRSKQFNDILRKEQLDPRNKSFDDAAKNINFKEKSKRIHNISLDRKDLSVNMQGEERDIFTEYINSIDTRELDYKRSKRNLSLLIKAERNQAGLVSNEKENEKKIIKMRALAGSSARKVWDVQNKDPKVLLNELLEKERKKQEEKLLDVHEREEFINRGLLIDG